MNKVYPQTHEWEKDCIKTRRNLWLRKKRLLQFNIQKNDHVLDLGCGDGLNIALLKKMGIQNIIGVDISSYLLKLAQKNNLGVKFYLADAKKLPFKDQTFDIVLADSVFHHLLNYPKSITEIKRVLKMGGYVCFVDPHKSFLRSLMDFITQLPISQMLPFFKGRQPAYLAEKDLMEYWLNNEQLFLNLLKKHGFKKDFCRVDLLSVIGQYQKV